MNNLYEYYCDTNPKHPDTDNNGKADGAEDYDQDGSCLPDCASAGLNCEPNGVCNDTTGTVACVCNTGYSGDVRALCAFSGSPVYS